MFCGEIKKYKYFSVEKSALSEAMIPPYLELCLTIVGSYSNDMAP